MDCRVDSIDQSTKLTRIHQTENCPINQTNQNQLNWKLYVFRIEPIKFQIEFTFRIEPIKLIEFIYFEIMYFLKKIFLLNKLIFI